ncbi:MAG: NAD(+)/NADH kinase [Kiritimatiellae bacterium]|nr:NAD(+)/NADH kinase [Kiritimatiellia bacterium]
MQTLGVTANCTKPGAAEVLTKLSKKARELGLVLMSCDETADLLQPVAVCTHAELRGRVDALVALGGDGTMLRAARLLRGTTVPVMGINIGSLGFLTSVAEKDMDRALACLKNDAFTTSARSFLHCDVKKDGKQAASHRALNDVVVLSGGSLRVVTLDVTVDSEEVTSYICDGLIVSTPTGSTGHSLSAGGPILHPATSAFIVTPICPHALSTRPLVVPDETVITVRIAGAANPLLLAVDGQLGEPLVCGDRIELRRDSESIRFIHLPDYSYFSVLRQKLGWRGSSV